MSNKIRLSLIVAGPILSPIVFIICSIY